jgi:hypothetical protein
MEFWDGGKEMRYTFAVVVATITLASANGAWATLLPTAQVGDTFSGTIYIDPNGPIWEGYPSDVTYGVTTTVGTLNVTIDGTALPTQHIDDIMAMGGPPFFQNTNPNVQWRAEYSLQPPTVYVDNYNGGTGGGFYGQIILGGSNSSSINPAPLSSYSSSFIEFNWSQQYAGIVRYDGILNTLYATDNLGDFAFSGTVTDFLSQAATPSPEPSTWAMMILGFIGIAFASYRKSHAHQLHYGTLAT